MMGFNAQAGAESALLCRMPGCRSRWTVDMGHGKVCSHHDEALSRAGSVAPPEQLRRFQQPMPLREAARPFAEPVEHDEEYVHDDPVSF